MNAKLAARKGWQQFDTKAGGSWGHSLSQTLPDTTVETGNFCWEALVDKTQPFILLGALLSQINEGAPRACNVVKHMYEPLFLVDWTSAPCPLASPPLASLTGQQHTEGAQPLQTTPRRYGQCSHSIYNVDHHGTNHQTVLSLKTAEIVRYIAFPPTYGDFCHVLVRSCRCNNYLPLDFVHHPYSVRH